MHTNSCSHNYSLYCDDIVLTLLSTDMNYGNGADSPRLIDTFYPRDSSGALLPDISSIGITAFNRGNVSFKDTLQTVYTRIAETTTLPIVVSATSSISTPASDPTFSKVCSLYLILFVMCLLSSVLHRLQ
jgi:hypothetical protein